MNKILRFALLLMVLAAGCRQQMADQPSYRPYQPSTFFPDGDSARPVVPGTVARGQLPGDPVKATGRHGQPLEWNNAAGLIATAGTTPWTAAGWAAAHDPHVQAFPMPITQEFLQTGRVQFNIYCAICHGRAGYGDGMVAARGFAKPPSYHIDRLRQARPGYIYDVIRNGYGAMPEHGSLVTEENRWAIVAYVRALQLSQHAQAEQLPENIRKQLP